MRRLIAFILVLSLVLSLFTGCKKDDGSKIPADFGSYGADLARELASKYPFRKAYSSEEAQAGEMIRAEFEKLGYEVQVQSFTGSDGKQSNNYVAIRKGSGFYSKSDGTTDYIPTERYVVIGAHYDSKYSKKDLDKFNASQKEEKGDKAVTYDYDGINDNASGIGALMTCARELPNYSNMAYNVILVAFGASSDDYAGAKSFFNALTPDVKSKLEAMFCIDSIYAGDKIYASSGMSSLLPGRKYSLRRKLYQAYDICYENSLYSVNGFNLLYNESGIRKDFNNDGSEDVYSEISENKSDYVPFDNNLIPVVFFDSFDYNFDAIKDMHDTKNLELQDFEGMVRGTYLDSMSRLDPILKTEEGDLLKTRINNVAFVILGTAMKGSDTALTYVQYMEELENGKNATQLSETT